MWPEAQAWTPSLTVLFSASLRLSGSHSTRSNYLSHHRTCLCTSIRNLAILQNLTPIPPLLWVFPNPFNWNGLLVPEFCNVYLRYWHLTWTCLESPVASWTCRGAPVVSYTLHLLQHLHWHIQDLDEYLSPALGKPFISHIDFSASSHPKKILAMTQPSLSLMRPTFNNCSAHQIQELPFYFPGSPAISLRQTLSFLTPLFNLLYLSYKHPLELP